MTTNLFVQESAVNVTEGYRCRDSEVYETMYDTRGDLYRAMQAEHGRCVGKVYVENVFPDTFAVVDIDKDNNQIVVGWIFQKLARYTDTNEPYLLETWVTVHDAEPTRTIEYHYNESEVK